MGKAVLSYLRTPLTINWSLSYSCNFSCSHCYSRGADVKELSTDEIKLITDKISDAKIPFVNFGGGEPLIIKDLMDITKYAVSKSLKVSMNSNGYTLDKKMAKAIKEAGFASVGISIDGATAKVHDSFRNMDGSFVRAIDALRNLNEAGVKTTMSSVISKINYKDFKALVDIAKENNVSQIFLHNFKCTGKGFQNREEYDLTPKEWRDFYTEALEYKNNNNDIDISFDDPVMASMSDYERDALVKGSTCGKVSLHIRPNGDITPCGFINIVIGNILKDDISDVWNNSEVLYKMRHKEPKNKCKSCASYEECVGGCTARALALTGDINNPDPHCWID
jgi:GeoRSP system radical SAM/SPASM protein